MSCQLEPWGLEFSQKEIAEARQKNKLLTLELEFSKVCNLRCVYCYSSAGMALENELTLDEIKDAVEQAHACGARKIIILGGGEPLLYPDLLEVIDHILQQGLRADIFTNGILIDAAMASALYERNVAVAVKMNSLVPEVQDFLAGKKGAFAAMQKGLHNLMRAGYPDDNHKLGVGTIICRQNIDEIPSIWRWAKKAGIVPYIETMTWQGRAKDHPELEVATEVVQDLFEKLAAIDLREFGERWMPHPPFAASQCARHEYSCTITSTGEVFPCPGVNIAAGNIRRQALETILRESKMLRDLRNIRTTIKGPCATCKLGDRCYGCRGHSYQVTGDYLASDPICWLHDENKIFKKTGTEGDAL